MSEKNKIKVKVLKKSINNYVGVSYTFNYITFINNILNAKLLQEKQDYFYIEVDLNNFNKQQYNDKIWYRSIDKKFGLFKDDELKFDSTKEKGWRVLFQRG